MKRFAVVLSVVALILAGAPVGAGDASKDTTFSGWITDESCGAKNANAEGKACALKCARNGAKLVLYVETDKKLIGLDNQEEAMKHVGVPVVITGTMQDGVIKVQKIEERKG